jgi:hypothetical protein
VREELAPSSDARPAPAGSRARAPLACLSALAAAIALSACGGGARQDASEPKARFPMRVLRASFPKAQAVARPATLELEVQNTGTRPVPDVAVTIDSFDYLSSYPGLGDRRRPIWAIERGPGTTAQPPVETQEVSLPGNATTAYVNTWALGRLASGQTRTFTWKVIPVRSGQHAVSYRLAAGLAGNAKAVAREGSLQGSFAISIAPAPPATHVNPETGKVVGGPYFTGGSS